MQRFILTVILCAAASSRTEAALVVNPAISITKILTVNPIRVSNDAGGSTATFMGGGSEETAIKGLIDTIWAQAGIDVEWLSLKTINNTEILDGSVGPNGNSPRPITDLSGDAGGQDHETLGAAVRVAGAVNMFFVNIAAGFSLITSTFTAAGFAEVPGNDISMYVGSSLPGFAGGQEVVAAVIAHEIGHNLSLPHLDVVEGLMRPGGSMLANGQRLNGAQVSAALMSGMSTGLLVAVPEPSAFWAVGLVGIACCGFNQIRWRQTRNRASA